MQETARNQSQLVNKVSTDRRSRWAQRFLTALAEQRLI
jgi:hypothetical protein